MNLKKFRTYKKVDARIVRFYMHQLPNIKTINPNILVEISKLKKPHITQLSLTDEEMKIIEKFGKKANEFINYLIYIREDAHETINRHIVSQKGQVEG
jgi:hypothetical protein